MVKKANYFVMLIIVLLIASCYNMNVVNANCEPEYGEYIIDSEYINKSSATVDISKSGVANIMATITCKCGNKTKISATVYLQKYNTSNKTWNDVNIWLKTNENLVTLSFNKEYQLNSTGIYRVKLVSKVWNGTKCETLNTYSMKKVY